MPIPAIYGTFLMLASYALMAITIVKALTRSKSQTKENDPGRLINNRDLDAVLPIPYGKTRLGGNQVFFTTTGVDSSYLHVILTLGEGQTNGIAVVDTIDQIFLDDKIWNESNYSNAFYYEFFDGSSTQNVCSTLNTAYSDWTDPLRYTSYIYCRFVYNRDEFLSVPNITVVLEGLKVKNFETEDDYDSMPMVYTDNLAYCIYDFLTRSSVRGGKGIDPTRINLTSFRDAADYYDTYGFTCNMPINVDQSVEDNLGSMLVNGRSEIIYSNNKFKLKFRDTREEAVCLQITEDDIIQNGKESTLEISPSTSLFTRPNAIKAKFINADKNYHDDEKMFRDDDAYNTEGDYRELSINLWGLSTLETVIPMSYYYLERARCGNTVNLTMGNKGLVLEPMDLVEITATMPGWTDSAKPLYRVETVQIHKDGNVSLGLLQEHDAFYNSDYDIDSSDLFITDLLSPSANVQSVINVSHGEEVYYYRDRSFTRWIIDFDPPLISNYPFWDYAEIWIKIGTGGWKFMTKATTDYQLDPVEESETYYLKIRSVSIYGVKENFDSCFTISKSILGKTGLPSDLTGITATIVNDTLNIFGDEISDPDIIGYEFRISQQSNSLWAAGLFLAFSTKVAYSLSGIKPGSYRVFCCALDNGGSYSENPVYADFTVEPPKGYTLFTTKDCDQPEGSHNNTEYYDQGSGDYCIRVTHTGGLTGTWTSAEKDIGAKRKVRVYGDFLTDLIDTSATWEALWPTPNIWSTRDMSQTWSEIIAYSKASVMKGKLKWGDSTGVYTSEADMFHLVSVDAEGRYFQVEVEIEDPNSDQYALLDGSGGSTVLTIYYYV